MRNLSNSVLLALTGRETVTDEELALLPHTLVSTSSACVVQSSLTCQCEHSARYVRAWFKSG